MRGELGSVLPSLAFPVLVLGGQWLLDIHSPPHLAVVTQVVFAASILAAAVTGTVVHELGHALAVRLVGGRVLGVRIGGRVGRVQWHLGSVAVSVGLGLGGAVTFRGHRLSAERRAVVFAAGPAASVLVTPFCLLLADPGWQDRPDAADILINGFRLDVPEAEDCLGELSGQPEVLLRLFLKPWALPDEPAADVTHIVHVLSWKVLVTGDLPATTADLAASRAEWVIGHLDSDHPDKRTPVHSARHTLAVARFRQGRASEARQLCTDALAAELDPCDRASVLATVAMARHARLLSGREQLDEALALDPEAPLVSEAARFLGGGWDTALAHQAT
jgi:hypothetical protein